MFQLKPPRVPATRATVAALTGRGRTAGGLRRAVPAVVTAASTHQDRTSIS